MLNLFIYLNQVARQAKIWWFYLISALVLLLSALFFQFVLHEMPCLLCIQVRLILSLLVLLAVLALIFVGYKIINILCHLSSFSIALALLERSYQLLGTERGFVFSDCGFSLGLPSWLAVERWLPFLYRVETSCGYTPEIIFGVTMAEALLLLSVFFVLFSLLMLLSVLLPNAKTR